MSVRGWLTTLDEAALVVSEEELCSELSTLLSALLSLSANHIQGTEHSIDIHIDNDSKTGNKSSTCIWSRLLTS